MIVLRVEIDKFYSYFQDALTTYEMLSRWNAFVSSSGLIFLPSA